MFRYALQYQTRYSHRDRGIEFVFLDLCRKTSRPLIDLWGFQVDVSDCTGYEGRCPLWLNTSHNFTLRFIPETQITSGAGLERKIFAKLPDKDGDRSVEIPYGPAVAANANTFRVSTGQPISQDGNQLTTGEWYLHNGIFLVIPQAPRVCKQSSFQMTDHFSAG